MAKRRTKAQRSASAKKGAAERARHKKAEAQAKAARKRSAAGKRGAVTRVYNQQGWTSPGRHDFKRRGDIQVGEAQAVFEELFREAEDSTQLAPEHEAYWKSLYTGRLVDADTDEPVKPTQWRSAGTSTVTDADKAFNLGRNIAIRYDETGTLASGNEYRVELREILVRVNIHKLGTPLDPNVRRAVSKLNRQESQSSIPSSISKPPRYRPTKKGGTKAGSKGGATRASYSGASKKTARSKPSKRKRKKR